MDRARVISLLDTMSERISRLEKALAPDVSDSVHGILQILISAGTNVRRFKHRIDALRPGEIVELGERIDELGNYSSAPGLDFRIQHPQYQNRKAREAVRDEALYLKNLTQGMLIGLQLTADDVRDLLPGQKPAAFRFAYDDVHQRIVLVDEPFRPAAREMEIASAALEEIILQGEEINEDLQRSNAAPRVKRAFAHVQERLVSNKNIVQVGMANRAAARSLKGYADELSQGQFEQLMAYVQGVFSVLAQFQEWREFSERAAFTELDRASILELTASALSLAKQLHQSGHAADDVPRAIEQVVEWVTSDEEPDKRDALSLVRTLENIWSLLTKNALSKTIADEGRKIIARGIVFATLGAIGFGFVAIIGRVPGADWIAPTFDYLRTNIQSFAPK